MTTSLCVANDNWVVTENPYRLTLALDQPLSSPAVVALDPQPIIDAVAAVAVDQVNQETFAFERAMLVNPDTGKVVGRFGLIRTDAPLDIDGDFAGLRQGKSPWYGFNPEKMTFETVDLDGRKAEALMVVEKAIVNAKLQQTVKLTPGRRYLLDYWIMMDTQDNEMGVMLNDPKLKLFAQVPHSYYLKMPPVGAWGHNQVIFRSQISEAQLEVRPKPEDAYLEVTHAFVGRGGVAELKLQPVAWRLIVEPDQPLEKLDLYVIARAGHRYTAVTDGMIVNRPPTKLVTAKLSEAQMQALNPDGVRVSSGDVSAWTIDPSLPMKVGAIVRYKLDSERTSDDAVARLHVFHGGSASLVIAVDNGRPRADDLQVTTDLPGKVTFHRLATIPVYDGPTVDGEVKGNLIETRYDPMVPMDFALDPDSEDGIHVIVATITPSDDTTAGKHDGNVTLTLDGQTLTVPVALNVAPLRIAPKRHFGTLFGGSYFHIANKAGVADMAEDSISIATYHGMGEADLTPPTIMSLSIPDNPNQRTTTIRGLAEKYFHVMLDNQVLPQSPALYAYFTYDIKEQGDGLAPKLTNWDFSGGYDKAIDEFVIGEDMPWLMVGRSNGYLMDKIGLSNGKTYSPKPNTDNPNWVQLSDEQFAQLVGDYWDNFAKHLDEKGILDRAIFVIDESGPDTYDTIYAYVNAMRSGSYGRQIKVGNTTYQASSVTHKLPDGNLLMDEVLDVPMPINDEHFNFFEPEWFSRYKRPKQSWVYNVETDHMNLENAGLSTIAMPLKLQQFGVSGWYCWESFVWSLPYAYLPGEKGGFKYGTGPVGNPWKNPFYHHGPGVLSFFYPPDPRGPAEQPTDLVIPSYRLTLMRDGIQTYALIDVLREKAGAEKVEEIEATMKPLWADNPTQWYMSYAPLREGLRQLHDLAMEQ